DGADSRVRGDARLRARVEPVHVVVRVEDSVRDCAVEPPPGRHALHLAMHIFKHTNFDFLRYRWHAIVLSWVLIIAGVITLATKGMPLGIEFAGGTAVIVQFDQPTSVQQVRQALDKSFPGGGQNVVVQTYGGPAARRGAYQGAT